VPVWSPWRYAAGITVSPKRQITLLDTTAAAVRRQWIFRQLVAPPALMGRARVYRQAYLGASLLRARNTHVATQSTDHNLTTNQACPQIGEPRTAYFTKRLKPYRTKTTCFVNSNNVTNMNSILCFTEYNNRVLWQLCWCAVLQVLTVCTGRY